MNPWKAEDNNLPIVIFLFAWNKILEKHLLLMKEEIVCLEKSLVYGGDKLNHKSCCELPISTL